MDSPFICVYQIRSDPKTTNQLRKKATEKRGFAVFQTDAVLNVAMAVEAKNRKRAMNAAKKEFEALLKDGILFDTEKPPIIAFEASAVSGFTFNAQQLRYGVAEWFNDIVHESTPTRAEVQVFLQLQAWVLEVQAQLDRGERPSFFKKFRERTICAILYRESHNWIASNW